MIIVETATRVVNTCKILFCSTNHWRFATDNELGKAEEVIRSIIRYIPYTPFSHVCIGCSVMLLALCGFQHGAVQQVGTHLEEGCEVEMFLYCGRIPCNVCVLFEDKVFSCWEVFLLGKAYP